METSIIVDNLKCEGCASTIKNNLNSIEGVHAVAVDVNSSEVLILHEFGVSKKSFLKRLAYLGYPEEGTSSSFQKTKSYVSCMFGRING